MVNLTVEFSKNEYKAGLYTVDVVVQRSYDDGIFWWQCGKNSTIVALTDLLNGNLMLIQNGIDKSDGVVIANEPVKHVIKISEEEMHFITKDYLYTVIWYLNCSVIEITSEFDKEISFVHTYTDVDDIYNLEILIAVENDPLIHYIIPLTTTTTTTTTEKPTTVVDDDAINHKIAKRYIEKNINEYGKLTNFKCTPILDGYSFGYYYKTIRIRRQTSDSSRTPTPSELDPLASASSNGSWQTMPSASNLKPSGEPYWRSTADATQKGFDESFWDITSARPKSFIQPYWSDSSTLEPRPLRNWSPSTRNPWSSTPTSTPSTFDEPFWSSSPVSTSSTPEPRLSSTTPTTSNNSFLSMTPNPNPREVLVKYWSNSTPGSSVVTQVTSPAPGLDIEEKASAHRKIMLNMFLHGSFDIDFP
ncbi:unnamed protein product [Arctia plantaginis]|uniref:Uncharacterized protein n=1 Tax=Arctia plantaginis TaxID=874455 RepID=A0A8S1B8N1_ARCPL|nr:unnamed protein product [Arctia plantaginis]